MKEYKCSGCGRTVGRENLRAKKVSFKAMGSRGTTERSRVVAWLCTVPNGAEKSCLERDPDWQAPSRLAAPVPESYLDKVTRPIEVTGEDAEAVREMLTPEVGPVTGGFKP